MMLNQPTSTTIYNFNEDDAKSKLKKYKTQLKYSFWSPKREWKQCNILDIPKYFDTLNSDEVFHGTKGLWIAPRLQHKSKVAYLPWLDIEHPTKHHEGIEANIETARNVFLQLDELNLVNNMLIGMSGKGFRFMWPFVIPSNYAQSFIYFTKKWHGIDPSPFGKNKWFRVLAYRGHKNQNKSVMDHHFEIISHSELFDAPIHTLVGKGMGKVSKEYYADILHRILPVTDELSKPWKEFLRKYERKAALQSNIVSFSFPAGPYANSQVKNKIQKEINWEQIEDFIAMYNPRVAKVSNLEYKLQTCPMCNRKNETSPYITAWGKLKCFSTNCPAHNGLMPKDYVPDYEPLQIEKDIAPKEKFYTIKESRNKISEVIKNSDDDILINATPGAGKTYTTLKTLSELAKDKLIGYTVATNEKAKEAVQEIREITNDTVDVIHYEGRNENNCFYVNEVNEVAKKGFSPGLVYCPKCPAKYDCDYKNQSTKSNGFIVMTHAKLYNSYDVPDMNILVMDEDFVKDAININEVSKTDIMDVGNHLGNEASQCLTQIINLGNESQKEIENPYETIRIYFNRKPPIAFKNSISFWADESSHEVRKKIYDVQMDTIPDASKRINDFQYYMDKEGMNPKAYYFIKNICEQNAYTYVNISNSKISYKNYYKNSLKSKIKNTRLIFLDGTGDVKELQSLFPDRSIQEHNINVKPNGFTLHAPYQTGKISCLGNGYDVSPMDEKHIRTKLKHIERYIDSKDQKILLVTWMKMKAKLESIMRDIFPDKEFTTIHFFGPRGVNIYKDYDACVVFGTPNVNPAGVYDFTTILFDNEVDQQKYIKKQGINDLYQMVHRIRPVLSNQKKIMILGKTWPAIGKPKEKIETYNKKEIAVQRLKPFLDEYGFIDKDICCVHGVYCALSAEEKKGWNRIREDKTLPGAKYPKLEFQDKHAYSDIIRMLDDLTTFNRFKYKVDNAKVEISAIGTNDARLQFYG